VLVSFLYEFGIDEDTTAVFADDDLLMKLQIYLALGWDLVEATTASITINGYDSKTIAGSFTDTSEGVEKTLLDTFFQADSFSTERFFFLLCFSLDTCQLLLLSLQVYTVLTDSFLESSDTLLAVLDLGRPFGDALLREFDLEALEFDFLGEVVVLAVVLDVVELLLIFLDALFSLLDLSLLGSYSLHLALVVLFEVLETRLHTFDLIFEVLYLEGEFTTEGLDMVDLGEGLL